ncbi:MAG: hypothetical protein CMN93_08295 [Synechococcus sp. CPC35]|nr:hypothetical protein [Synechococcus sp. CPC35]
MMRILYFAALIATGYWLIALLWRKLLATRQVNVIVESPERTAQINALESALKSDEGETDAEIRDDSQRF